ncbi:leucyl aminopeptidase [Nitrososphaera sp.]|uniref:leucyl aminopeptidase n=1 Tax=Nitrososphaera sp. TaxID=1971748 RepID=UPI00307EAFCD
MAQIKVEKAKIDQKQTSLLVIGVFENEQDFSQSKELDPSVLMYIKAAIDNKDFRGTFGSSILVYTLGKGPMQKILALGLGKREKFTDEMARICAGKAAQKAKELGTREFSILQFSNLDEGLIEAMTEGIALALYSFDRYKAQDKETQRVEEVTVLINSDSPRFQMIAERASHVAEAVNFARDLGNLPPNDCPPAHLASVALSLAAEYGMKARVIDRYELENMGMGGIVAVGKGSNNPPKLIILEYTGAAAADARPYLLVGKAVTFDTGGISLKPGDKMDEMKFDKCGGCDVLAILRAVASMKLAVNVVGIVPSVENMPSSTSYRPGDIVRMYNGKTVEVLNTDAEGRMILADALAYGIATYNPKAVIDMATLTGAAIIALGANVAALIGNNKQLTDRVRRMAEKAGERMWDLPLYDEFHEQIKSPFADIKNVGGRPGGAITAAAFLSNFVTNVPWVHMDIAGTAWTQDGTYERSYNPKGATGFGIRTLVKLLMEEEKPQQQQQQQQPASQSSP